jgi:hypothetical protein
MKKYADKPVSTGKKSTAKPEKKIAPIAKMGKSKKEKAAVKEAPKKKGAAKEK